VLLVTLFTIIFVAGKVHGSLARAGKVRGQTPKVAKQEKKKNPKGRAMKRIKYNRRFVNVGELQAALCSKNIASKAHSHSHSQLGQATDRPTVCICKHTHSTRQSCNCSAKQPANMSAFPHTRPLPSTAACQIVCAQRIFGWQSCARQLTLTECDIKPLFAAHCSCRLWQEEGP